MITLDSLHKMNPSFFPQLTVKPVKSKKVTAKPVSKPTIKKVIAALKGMDWLSFSQVKDITGFTSGTISRASKYLVHDKIAITKVDEHGQSRKSWLKLVA